MDPIANKAGKTPNWPVLWIAAFVIGLILAIALVYLIV